MAGFRGALSGHPFRSTRGLLYRQRETGIATPSPTMERPVSIQSLPLSAATLRLIPTWVWALLFFLIYRAVYAQRPRHTPLSRALLAPVFL